MTTDQRIMPNIPNILCIQDPEGKWLQASPVYLKLLGLENIEYHGKTNKELSLICGDCANALQLTALKDEQAWSKGQPVNAIETFKNPNLTTQALELTKTPIYDQNNQAFLLIISGTSLNPSKNKLRELKFLSAVFTHNIESMIIVDLQFNIIRVNQAFTHLTGYAKDEISGQHLSMINAQQHSEVIFRTIQTCIQNNRHWQGEISCRRSDRSTFPAKLSLTPIISRTNNKIRHFIGTLSNISKQKANEQHTLRLTQYDSLTELPNRFMFIDRLNQELSRSKRHQLHTVVLIINLHQLKSINEKADNPVSEELLKVTAQRLSDSLRCEDIVARIENDEFAILLDSYKSHDQAKQAGTIIATKVIHKLAEPIHVQNQQLKMSNSIGIAIYPEDAKTTQELLKLADIAKYQAKRTGQDNFNFFQAKQDVALDDKAQLVLELRKALENNEFHLVYQPQFATKSRALVGAEVLVRWFKSNQQMVPPYYFIPIAEESGLMIKLGQWILETACKKQKDWLDSGHQLNKIAVNISPKQFKEPHFLRMVENTLKKTGLPPEHLELEIKESMFAKDSKGVILKLLSLHNLGISVAVDDYTGDILPFAKIKNVPINILKINRSIIREIPESSYNKTMVSTIIETAHSLGLTVVAEGVETEEQLSFLINYKCDIIQGYLFNPPLPEHEMSELH